MKKLFVMSIYVLLLANIGCGVQTETQQATGDISVQIPVRENNQPQLKTVTLRRMEDLRRVTGGYAAFFFAPKIEGNQVIGEVPHARFIKVKSGTFIPADTQSAEMAAIYYHLQSLADLDQKMGVGHVNKWPRRVAISTRILEKDDLIMNNSFYDQNSDTMIFVDYQSPDLSLALNSGVVAHEHFHSLFSKIILLPLIKAGKISEGVKASAHNAGAFSSLLGAPEINVRLDETSDIALKKSLKDFVLFKGLNEGLADYWAWLYSNDEDYVARSIPGEASRRTLSEPTSAFDLPSDRMQRVDDWMAYYNQSNDRSQALEAIQKASGHYAYEMGNTYARFFRRLTKNEKKKDLTGEEKTLFVKKLISLMYEIRDDFISTQETKFLEPEDVVQKFKKSNPDVFSKHCAEFKTVMNAELSCGGRQR